MCYSSTRPDDRYIVIDPNHIQCAGLSKPIIISAQSPWIFVVKKN